MALRKFGAKTGQGTGLMGRSYGIATKDRKLRVLPLSEIHVQIYRFLRFASANPQLTFVVTRIGCGLAGYSTKDIAPMFATPIKNVVLPKGWKKEW